MVLASTNDWSYIRHALKQPIRWVAQSGSSFCVERFIFQKWVIVRKFITYRVQKGQPQNPLWANRIHFLPSEPRKTIWILSCCLLQGTLSDLSPSFLTVIYYASSACCVIRPPLTSLFDDQSNVSWYIWIVYPLLCNVSTSHVTSPLFGINIFTIELDYVKKRRNLDVCMYL